MTCWEILGVPETATVEEVKRAYRNRSFSVHPDHGGSVESFHRLKLAYVQALDLAGRPELCDRCNGIGYYQLPTVFMTVVCDKCKGIGTCART